MFLHPKNLFPIKDKFGIISANIYLKNNIFGYKVEKGRVKMKSFVKVLIALTCAGLVINSVSAKNYSDLSKNHWASPQIQKLSTDDVVIGYPDETFKADQPVSRAEFATMVVKALGQENCILKEIYYFSDVPQNYWAYDMIQKAQSFDLLKVYSDGTFKPDDNINKADAVYMMIASVETSNITEAQAKKALKVYKDVAKIPAWDVLSAGKAEILKVTAHNPASPNLFNPDAKISRAELAVSLYNMRKQALKRPNSKLALAMQPIKATGTVIDPVSLNGTIATIPEGTLLPVTLLGVINSQKSQQGEVFVTEVKDNLVTKDNYLLIAQGTYISGQITDLIPAKYFIRNAKAIFEAQNINTVRRQKTEFPGSVDLPSKKYKWYQKALNFVIKGRKIKLNEGDQIYVKLKKPVRIDLTNSTILK